MLCWCNLSIVLRVISLVGPCVNSMDRMLLPFRLIRYSFFVILTIFFPSSSTSATHCRVVLSSSSRKSLIDAGIEVNNDLGLRDETFFVFEVFSNTFVIIFFTSCKPICKAYILYSILHSI